ncbi:MAG TPA: hypothetical protein VLQ79_01605, partial [Myxococcaceae bacterium]|nr:hypothetical protein [Myxococcaceae bacterium]
VHAYLSPEFELAGTGALRVELSSNAADSWTAAEGAVINTARGDVAPFGLEASYYSGVDDGERWTEDHRTASIDLPSPGPGTAILRADLQWEEGRPPPDVRLRLRGETFSLWQFIGCLALLSWPLVYPLRRAAFERARWENSNLGGEA